MNILLVGKTPAVIADVLDQVDAPAVTFFSGSSFEDAVGVLESAHTDHVILGGGLELDDRLQIVRSVFENSASTTVHMNSPSGPESYCRSSGPYFAGLTSGTEAYLHGAGRTSPAGL